MLRPGFFVCFAVEVVVAVGFALLDSGGTLGTSGSSGTVMLLSLADLRVTMVAGCFCAGGIGCEVLLDFLWSFGVIFRMELLILSEVFNLAGAEIVRCIGPGLSGCMGLRTSWPFILSVFRG